MARLPWTSAAIAVIASTLLPTVSAQSITLLPPSASDSFPACGLSCSLLIQAQDGCVPPAAPNTDQAIYVSCFCQSALLTSLHSNPNGICDDTCPSASDRSKIMEWYNSFCASGGEIHTTSPDQTSPSVAPIAPSSSPSATPSSVTTTQPTSSGHSSWWSTHYKWVIMIIVLVIAFTAIGIGGMYLKRRHDAKNPGLYHGAERSTSTGILSRRAPGSSASPRSLNANQFAAPPRRADLVKSDTIPSDLTAPRDGGLRTPPPARLQRPHRPEADEPEIREIRPI